MQAWQLGDLVLTPRLPEILSSTAAGRLLALDLAADEALGEHEVHERAWIIVVHGDLEVTTLSDGTRRGGPGLLVELAPGERHAVRAYSASRLLVLLAPWPGDGHPGAMSMREKLYVRQHAARRR